MLIGSRQRISTFNSEPALAINNIPVKRVSHTKSLGIHIDQHLSWNVHIVNLCKKVASGIGACSFKANKAFCKFKYITNDI